MTKYKILLKKHWKKRGEKTHRTERYKETTDPEPPDLGDLEVKASTRSLYSRKLRIAPVGDPEVRERIRTYRVISSLLVYSMIFSMLFFSTNFVNTTMTSVRAQREKELEKQAATVSRKMTTNFTQDEEMSRLDYDSFIQKVEEEIKNKKRKRIVPVQPRNVTNSTLAMRKEIGLKAFKRRFSTSSKGSEVREKTEASSIEVKGKQADDTAMDAKQTLGSPIQPVASSSGGSAVNSGTLHQQNQNTQLSQPDGSHLYLPPRSSKVA